METSNAESTTVSGGVMETTSAEETAGTTLGNLTNVNSEVDELSAYDEYIGRNAGEEKYSRKKLKDIQGKDGVIAYPTMFLNPITGRLTLQVPTNNYENRFTVENGHLILKQS